MTESLASTRTLVSARRCCVEKLLDERRAAIAERLRVCNVPARSVIGMPTFGWAEAHPLSAGILDAIWAGDIYGIQE